MDVNKAFRVFALLTVLTMVSDRILFVVFPNYLLQKQFSATQIGIIFSAASFVLLVSRALIGRASDRFGRKRIMSLGLLSESISMLLFPAVSKIYEFSFVKSLRETAGTLTSSVENAIIGDLFDEKVRDKIIRKLGNVFVFGRALAVAVGFVIATYFSLAFGFYVAAVALFIAFLVFTAFIQEAKPKKERVQRTPAKKFSLGFKLVVMVSFLQAITFTAAYYPGFFILAKDLGIAENVLFLLLLITYVTSGPIIYFTNKRVDVCCKPKLLFASQLFYSLLIIAYPFSTSLLQFFLILFGVHLSFIYYWIAFKVVFLNNTTANHRGEQVGFEKMVEGIGEVVGPAIGGILIDTVSLSSTFFLAGAVGIASSFVAYFLIKNRPVV